jgi:bifunctional oligoribonuclease and PAP phosphatase NrnA
VYDTTQAVGFIQRYQSFLVLGHKEPDGDCVASQVALAALLRAVGKDPSLHSAGPFDRPEIGQFASQFTADIPAARRAGAATAVIIVDCSTPDRTGSLGAKVQGIPTLVIDHHSAGTDFGDARMVDSSAPASTMLILALFEAFGKKPDAATARMLLFGLCTDTGFFRHLGGGSEETYRSVARLVELGTSTADVYMLVYGRRELSSRKLLAEMLQRTESHAGGKLLVTWQTISDRERLQAHQRGEDEVYRLLQTVNGNVVVALIKEEAEGRFSVGLRSSQTVDVGAIAASLGGGGHRQASGFDIEGTLESVKAAVLKALLPFV